MVLRGHIFGKRQTPVCPGKTARTVMAEKFSTKYNTGTVDPYYIGFIEKIL